MKNRRQFLLEAMAWSAGLGLPVPLWDATSAFAIENTPKLVVVTGKSYDILVTKALETLGWPGAFIKNGDKVVIKPNIGWDRNVAQGANSHPIVVVQLAKLALDAGAGEVKIFDHTCNEKRRCYVNSGIQDGVAAIGDKRVRLLHIDQRKFVPVDIKNGKSLSQWEIYRDALEADVYINVPVAKHHGLSRLTLGLKNAMGVIGGRRGSLHFNLGQKLADLATVIRPTLTVVDATRLLMRNGPQGGNEDDVEIRDTVIASTDPVAADAYATTLFGLKPEEIDSTVAAHAMGLGEMDPAKMRIQEFQL
ncbi:DUF362 domain-containing protein [Desulfopila aestuarii]|uniref:Uncharacterized conserved protein, DUF362 family n=1 Tax=Desulfopila aestuarii DSM 18488 TaxID=1121416 RepID=A0A1M7Y628_9BACT|nr:DUF362 domain-containing protein [Desulfopila aestuarii]SHO47849.1 Uncharacterized conserved protein, DUF362 family [Desulfopila aestuarii DSM 18488]